MTKRGRYTSACELKEIPFSKVREFFVSRYGKSVHVTADLLQITGQSAPMTTPARLVAKDDGQRIFLRAMSGDVAAQPK